jgi:hypothetical protein
MELNTMEILKKIKNVVEEKLISKMEIILVENLMKMFLMVKDIINGKMVMNMLVNIKVGNLMEKENIYGMKKNFMLETM